MLQKRSFAFTVTTTTIGCVLGVLTLPLLGIPSNPVIGFLIGFPVALAFNLWSNSKRAE